MSPGQSKVILVDKTDTECCRSFVTYVYYSTSASHRHGRKRSRAHCEVWQLVRAAVGVDVVKVRPRHVHASEHERRRHVSLLVTDRKKLTGVSF